MSIQTRRAFLAQLAALSAGGAVAIAGQTRSRSRWTERLGLQVYTVRDRLQKDFEGTLQQVAAAGYKEVELFGTLGDRTPKQVRAILDGVGLAAVSTHISVAAGPDLERQLEGYQVMGHRFAAVRTGGPPAGSAQGAAARGGPGRGSAPPALNNTDRWKRQAEALNEVGRAGQKFGIRALVHNHVVEFLSLEDGRPGTGYDILLAETDPNLVAMELDIGWASVAGQDPIAMFKKHPGRYPLWHVKDVSGLGALTAKPVQDRQSAVQFAPVGDGDIDYKQVFDAASTAGLQHFFIEQDNAVNGDSVAAISASARNLRALIG